MDVVHGINLDWLENKYMAGIRIEIYWRYNNQGTEKRCFTHHLWLQNGIDESGTGSGQSTTNRSPSGGKKGILRKYDRKNFHDGTEWKDT